MIELACIADGNYLRHTGAMLHSVLSHLSGSSCFIRILHGAPIDAAERRRIDQLVQPFGARLQLVQIEAARVSQFPSGYFPRSVWFRVLLPELMPEADKVLYLDSDLIVTDDLQPLWETSIDGQLLAAVTNPFYPFMPSYPRDALGFERPQDYFNSGVLLMNLAEMRAQGAVQQLRAYACSHPGAAYPDQDALNVVCRGRWKPLHPRWNVQSTLFELAPAQLPLPAAEVAEALARPAVIHFIGPFKPWHYLCRHPRQALYLEHARTTPWGAPALEGRSLRNAVLRQLPIAWIDRWFRAERAAARLWRRAQQSPEESRCRP